MIDSRGGGSLRDKEDRRSGIDRRRFSYGGHIPERRSGTDRRSGMDRRRGVQRRNGQDRRTEGRSLVPSD